MVALECHWQHFLYVVVLERVYSYHLILQRICNQKKVNVYSLLANTLPTHLQKYRSLSFCLQMTKYLDGRLETETIEFLCKQTAFHLTAVMGHA